MSADRFVLTPAQVVALGLGPNAVHSARTGTVVIWGEFILRAQQDWRTNVLDILLIPPTGDGTEWKLRSLDLEQVAEGRVFVSFTTGRFFTDEEGRQILVIEFAALEDLQRPTFGLGVGFDLRRYPVPVFTNDRFSRADLTFNASLEVEVRE